MNIPDGAVETRTIKIWLGDDGIIYALFHRPHTIMTLEDGKENREAIFHVAGGRPRPLLGDIRNLIQSSREARPLFVSSEASRAINSVALLVGTPASRFFGNLFVSFAQPPYPTRVFQDQTKALEWLRQFVQEEP